MSQVILCDVAGCGKLAERVHIKILSPIWNGTAYTEYLVERDFCEEHFKMLTGHRYKQVIGYSNTDKTKELKINDSI